MVSVSLGLGSELGLGFFFFQYCAGQRFIAALSHTRVGFGLWL